MADEVVVTPPSTGVSICILQADSAAMAAVKKSWLNFTVTPWLIVDYCSANHGKLWTSYPDFVVTECYRPPAYRTDDDDFFAIAILAGLHAQVAVR
ncbi:MAG: hypothetical protein AAGA91_10300 [Pseudomonadota bacterium]